MKLSPRRQGDLGEFSAIEWFGSQGIPIFYPLGHSPDVDLIADYGDRLARVQVKTTGRFEHHRWQVMICTRGGNQSWSGLTKRFSHDRCDELFVLVGDGRRWLIPAAEVAGGNGILLGGPKYARFEIDPGRPLPLREVA